MPVLSHMWRAVVEIWQHRGYNRKNMNAPDKNHRTAPRSVSGEFANLIGILTKRYLPDDANNPQCADYFWRDTKFWCAFMGNFTFIILNTRHMFAGKVLEKPERVYALAEVLYFASLQKILLVTYVVYMFAMAVFFSWLVYHMSNKVGRTRAYLLGLLLPTITIHWSSMFATF